MGGDDCSGTSEPGFFAAAALNDTKKRKALTNRQTRASTSLSHSKLHSDLLKPESKMSSSTFCDSLSLNPGCRGHPCPRRCGTHGGFHYNYVPLLGPLCTPPTRSSPPPP